MLGDARGGRLIGTCAIDDRFGIERNRCSAGIQCARSPPEWRRGSRLRAPARGRERIDDDGHAPRSTISLSSDTEMRDRRSSRMSPCLCQSFTAMKAARSRRAAPRPRSRALPTLGGCRPPHRGTRHPRRPPGGGPEEIADQIVEQEETRDARAIRQPSPSRPRRVRGQTWRQPERAGRIVRTNAPVSDTQSPARATGCTKV